VRRTCERPVRQAVPWPRPGTKLAVATTLLMSSLLRKVTTRVAVGWSNLVFMWRVLRGTTDSFGFSLENLFDRTRVRT
jgi:F420-0:gamma-glutamyl ligase